MATLRHALTGRLCVLEAEHIVGRSPQCGLHLNESYASAQHASIRFNGQGWELKDLGSRNGTFLDDAELERAHPHLLKQGAVLAFGKLEQRWEVIDLSAPKVMAVALGSGNAVVLDGEI